MELKRDSSEEEGGNTGCDSGGEKEEGRRVITEGNKEEITDMKTGMMAPCRPKGGQRLGLSPVRRIA